MKSPSEDKPKKAGLAIALLLGKPKGKPSGGEDDEKADDGREEGVALAREALDAMKANDEEAFYDAVHALVQHCDALPHVEGEHEDEDDDEDEAPPSSRKGY